MTEKAPYPIDMHCHSTRSDGGDTYAELTEVAKKRGVSAFVVADHDVSAELCPEGEPLLKFSEKHGAYIIPAIEFSCDTLVPDVHIVGVGCDFKKSEFRDFEREMSRSKVDGYRKIVELLREDGLDISWDSVLHQSGMDIDENALQGKHIFNAIAIAGGAEDWSAAKKMIQTTPRYSAIKREKIDPARAIDMVLSSGGFPILAHPFLITDEPRGMTRWEYIDRLVSAGLLGIEGPYPYDKTSYRGSDTPDHIESLVRERYGDRLFISGGSDYHNDAKSGSKHPRLMGEKGVTREDIIACPRLLDIVRKWAPALFE